jgi:hypothetical protein
VRALILLPVALATACATTPEQVYDLMDAETDEARAEASAEAAALVRDRRRHRAVRMAAARTLGRLRVDDEVVVSALRETLLDGSSNRDVRAYAAWALGELRTARSLDALASALRLQLQPLVGEHVLEGLTKHYAVMSKDHETLVRVVEGLVFFAGNHQGGALPPTYDLLSVHTRTIPVNVEVLARAIDAMRTTQTPGSRAAMYNAAYELLAKLESNKDEVVAGAAAWETRVRAAVDTSVQASRAGHRPTSLLVLWYLGRLAEVPEVARPSAVALAKPAWPTADADPKHRLVAAWTLARMQVHALGPRRALLMDLASRELEPTVLRILADVSPRSDELDQLQKVLGLK